MVKATGRHPVTLGSIPSTPTMNTTKIIEFLISGVIVLRGLYYAYAFWVPGVDDPVLVTVTGYPHIMVAIGVLMIVPGVITMLGNFKNRMNLKNIGLFVTSLCFIFVSIMHMLAEAIRPFSWVYPLTLACIAGVVWLHNMQVRRWAEDARIS